MGAEIDRLEVQVEAQATKANNALDKLVANLEKLEKSLTHINVSGLSGLSSGISKFASASAQLSSIDSRKFDTIAKNINKLSTFNTQQLYGASHAMRTLANSINSLGGVSSNSLQVAQVAKDISKLGGKNVQVAITNLPQLAVEMNNLMGTLARAPQVSNNVIAMTRALANLASQGKKVGTASKGLIGSLNQTGNAMTANTKKAFSLSSAIGKLYQSYYWVMRAGNALWDSIESTSDYIEAYNYFDVTLGKIGSEWAHQWEDYADKIGVSSAEEYANSFQTRLSQSLSKLSGVQIDIGADGSGLLTETGMKNLGLNIQEVTQYASQLASVTNSVGQTGEVSLAAASVFTKLGADMSSLFNADYSSVMKNLQSGLIGQSRALYKYGIDITNATLQTYAYELELGKAVSEMTQAEKMQLRMLAILDQSKVSWGDLANTINSPSNMTRQFGNNMKEAGMVLGQLFVPLLQKVLPIANGLAIAFKQLFVSIASLLGIKLDLGSFGQGYTDLEEDIGGVSDGFEEASNAAKKLKGQLQGFDELNVIKTDDSSGSGSVGGIIDLTQEILEATAEYEKVWAEAYAKMQNKAQEFAEKIAKIFEPLKAPFTSLIESIKIGDWEGIGESSSDLAIAFTDLLSDAIEDVEWETIGNNIGEFLKGIKWKEVFNSVGNFFDTAMDAAIELWEGAFDTAPIETAIVSGLAIAKFTGLDTSLSSAFSASLNGKTIGITATVAISAIVAKIGFEKGKDWGKELFPEDADWYDNFKFTGKDGFFSTLLKDIPSVNDAIKKMFSDWENNPKLSAILALLFPGASYGLNMATSTENKFQKLIDDFTSLKDKVSEISADLSLKFFLIGNSIGTFKNTALENFDKLKAKMIESFANMADSVIGSFNKIITGVEKIINGAIDGLNALSLAINPFAGFAEFAGIELTVEHISLPKIPEIKAYAVGGFPEDGLFYANHNELVGRFSNGKTAVANNEQIVEGIKYGVREAVAEVLAPYLADIAQNTRETADKEFGITERDVASAFVNQNRKFHKRTGRTLSEA